MIIKNLQMLFFGALVCTPGIAQSQFAFSFDLAPNYSYRVYKLQEYSEESDSYPSGQLIFDNFKEYYDAIEEPGFGFGFTLGIHFIVKNRVNFRSGLGYKNIREKLSFTTPQQYYFADGQTLVYYTDENNTTNKFNTYHYLTLPIDFQYNALIWNKISLGLTIGSDFDFSIGNDLTNHSATDQADPKYEFGHPSKVALSLRGGVILDYKIKENVSLFIQPEFVRNLTPAMQYDLHASDEFYCKITQINYQGQIRIGIIFNK